MTKNYTPIDILDSLFYKLTVQSKKIENKNFNEEYELYNKFKPWDIAIFEVISPRSDIDYVQFMHELHRPTLIRPTLSSMLNFLKSEQPSNFNLVKTRCEKFLNYLDSKKISPHSVVLLIAPPNSLVPYHTHYDKCKHIITCAYFYSIGETQDDKDSLGQFQCQIGDNVITQPYDNNTMVLEFPNIPHMSEQFNSIGFYYIANLDAERSFELVVHRDTDCLGSGHDY